MSEEAQVKKRGRPKKVVEDTIIVIDSTVSNTTNIQSSTKKIDARRSIAKVSEKEPALRKRAPRKSVTQNVVDAEKPKPTRTKKTAKSIENVSNQVERDLTSSPASSILQQATAFQEINSAEISSPESIPSLGASNNTSSTEKRVVEETIGATAVKTPPSNQRAIEDLQIQFNNVKDTINEYRQNYIELALTHSLITLQLYSDATAKLRRIYRFNSRTKVLTAKLDSLSDNFGVTESEIRQLQRDQRQSRVQQITTRLSDLERTTSQLHVQTTELKQDRILKPPEHNNLQLEETDTDSRVASATPATEQPAIITTNQRQVSIAQTPPLPISTTTMVPTKPSIASPATYTAMQTQPSSSSNLNPSTATSNQPQSQFRPPIKPNSQTHHPTPTTNPNSLPSQSQPRPQPQTELPPARRPTSLPLETLRKDPKFKSQSRKWTGLIIGIPVLVMSSWVLYRRYEDTLFKRDIGTEAEKNGRTRGQLPGDRAPGMQSGSGSGSGSGKGIGIGVGRSSDVGHNGGV